MAEIQNLIDHFNARTKYHIDLVKKYADKIDRSEILLPRDAAEMLALTSKHDASKYEEPEYTPYLHITWKYKCIRDSVPYEVSKEIESKQNEATFHHVKNNPHHPEYWDDKVIKEAINPTNRDRPSGVLVDGTKMPLAHIACMCADWMAVAEEKKTNPLDWAKSNINVRWRFDKDQEDLIYRILNTVWP
jgi:hypothetical protein